MKHPKIALFCLCLTLVQLVGCGTMVAYVDYDRQADLASYQTYAWGPEHEPTLASSSPMMHARLVDAIQSKLDRTMKRVDANPDLLVTYHTDSRQEVQIDHTQWGMDPGPGWYPDPHWRYRGPPTTTTTRVSTYTQGTLIVDIWEAKTGRLIWRGTVEDVVEVDPEKRSKQIYEAIELLSIEWKKMRNSGH